MKRDGRGERKLLTSNVSLCRGTCGEKREFEKRIKETDLMRKRKKRGESDRT